MRKTREMPTLYEYSLVFCLLIKFLRNQVGKVKLISERRWQVQNGVTVEAQFAANQIII